MWVRVFQPSSLQWPRPSRPRSVRPIQFSQNYQQLRGPYSQAVEPFRIIGNIYYVGGVNIASYLITTPQGHILIDTGMTTMHNVIKGSVAKLGFKTSDIKIMLSSHAHFDHIEGHAAMRKLTGARVMAMVGDAEALESGKDNSALGAMGWEPVKVDRVLKHGDTVSLGGATLRAVHSPGHTQGATTWFMTVEDKGKQYRAPSAALLERGRAALPQPPTRRREDTQRTFKTLKSEKVPDMYLVGHPQAMFAGKVDRIKAGEIPHPLLNSEAWTKQIADAEANFQKRVAAERAKAGH